MDEGRDLHPAQGDMSAMRNAHVDRTDIFIGQSDRIAETDLHNHTRYSHSELPPK